jgi:isoquinoline 1-oxidoreductase subunit alpha
MSKPPEPIADAPRQEPARPPAPLAVSVNGEAFFHEGDPAMPLLWFLRDTLRLTGTKYGCGIGACGACTVLIDGKAARSCVTPMQVAAEHAITTIEGLATDTLHPVQQAWVEEDVAQCGYCQAGQIMAAVDLLQRKARPGEADIAAIGNLCRCGTYPRIRRAIERAGELMRSAKK